MENIHIFIGGHAKHNNGDAGTAVCFYTDPEGEPFFEEAEYIGQGTQNSAVYKAIWKALSKACTWQFKRVTVYSDNRLVVAQLMDNMAARAPAISALHSDIKKLAGELEQYRVAYISSKHNRRARLLAKAAAMASADTITSQILQFEVGPGITGVILAFTPKMMIVRFKYKKGSEIGLHRHFHEQAGYVLRGSLKYEVAGKEIIIKKDAGLVVSSNAAHQIEALEDTTELVVYSPMRADLLKIS